MSENRFKTFIESLFLAEDTTPQKEPIKEDKKEEEVILTTEEQVAEVKEVLEQIAEITAKHTEDINVIKEQMEAATPGDIYSKEEVDEIVKEAIEAIVETVKEPEEVAMSKQELARKIAAIELELNTPSKSVEKVIPPVKDSLVERPFSMAAAIKNNK